MSREATIWEHAEELLVRLRRALIALIISTLIVPFIPISLSSYKPLLIVVPDLILNYAVPRQIDVFGHTIEVLFTAESPFAGLKIYLYSAILVGFIFASPYIAYQIYAFIEPALYPHEKRWLLMGAPVAIILFLMGVALALLVVLPFTYTIMFTLSATVAADRLIAYATIESIMASALLITIATGAAFEIPLIIFILTYTGIINVESLTGDTMKYLLVLSAVIAALISPDPSGLGMMLVLIPYFTMITVAVTLANTLRRRKR
ncbi:MAG: twin-arginine translocase subunit TatC [Thermoprotei archaeon]|nr:twin-arginine translocase subunit TatC [Thermoprotei archaeon]